MRNYKHQLDVSVDIICPYCDEYNKICTRA